MPNDNQIAFEARIQRLSEQDSELSFLAGEGDVSNARLSAGAVKRLKSQGRATDNLILAVPKWAAALVIGGLSVLAARLLSFHLLGQFLDGGDMMTIIMRQTGELAAAFGILVTLATFGGVRSGMAKAAMLAGFLGMVLCESEIAKQMPLVWEGVFSSEYAATVLAPGGSATDKLRIIAQALQVN